MLGLADQLAPSQRAGGSHMCVMLAYPPQEHPYTNAAPPAQGGATQRDPVHADSAMVQLQAYLRLPRGNDSRKVSIV